MKKYRINKFIGERVEIKLVFYLLSDKDLLYATQKLFQYDYSINESKMFKKGRII